MAAPVEQYDDAYFERHLHRVSDLMPQYLALLACRAINHRTRGERTALSAIEAGRPDLAAGILRGLIRGEQ
jgi:hypothetical protein